MDRRWLAVPAILFLAGCRSPVTRYREAARQLTFTLEQVEPRAQLAFPLEDSRLSVRLTLGVDNPSDVRFKVRSVAGRITLDSEGDLMPIGTLDLVEKVDLKAGSRTPMVVDLAFGYGDLQQAWSLLRKVTDGDLPGTWHLDGQAGLDAFGVPVTVPLSVKKRVSRP